MNDPVHCFRSWVPPSSLIPRPYPKNREKGLVTLAKIPVCPVSGVFIWSREITFIHYQLLNSSLIPRSFENGNEASRPFVNLEFNLLLFCLTQDLPVVYSSVTRYLTFTSHPPHIDLTSFKWWNSLGSYSKVLFKHLALLVNTLCTTIYTFAPLP